MMDMTLRMNLHRSGAANNLHNTDNRVKQNETKRNKTKQNETKQKKKRCKKTRIRLDVSKFRNRKGRENEILC